MLPWKVRLRLLHDIVLGMEYLHDKEDSIHHDLKCDNVLLTEEKGLLRAKVADFGTSRFGKQMSMKSTNELETKDSDSSARTISSLSNITHSARNSTDNVRITMTHVCGTYVFALFSQNRIQFLRSTTDFADT